MALEAAKTLDLSVVKNSGELNAVKTTQANATQAFPTDIFDPAATAAANKKYTAEHNVVKKNPSDNMLANLLTGGDPTLLKTVASSLPNMTTVRPDGSQVFKQNPTEKPGFDVSIFPTILSGTTTDYDRKTKFKDLKNSNQNLYNMTQKEIEEYPPSSTMYA